MSLPSRERRHEPDFHRARLRPCEPREGIQIKDRSGRGKPPQVDGVVDGRDVDPISEDRPNVIGDAAGIGHDRVASPGVAPQQPRGRPARPDVVVNMPDQHRVEWSRPGPQQMHLQAVRMHDLGMGGGQQPPKTPTVARRRPSQMRQPTEPPQPRADAGALPRFAEPGQHRRERQHRGRYAQRARARHEQSVAGRHEAQLPAGLGSLEACKNLEQAGLGTAQIGGLAQIGDLHAWDGCRGRC